MKRVAFVILLLVTLITGFSVQAQSLSAGDEKLLAAADSAALKSFAFQYQAQVAVDGLSSFALEANWSGSGMVDNAVPTLDISAKGTIKAGTTQNIPFNDELRWLNDTLYLNPGDGWQLMSGASDYLANLINQYGGVNVDASGLSKWQLASIGGLTDIIKALTSGDPSSFLSVQRLADDTVGSTKAAHFQSVIDLHALMQTDAFASAVGALAQDQGNNLVTYDHADLAKIVQTNSAMFANSKITLDQYVGMSDSLLHRIVLTLDLPIDPTQGSYPDPAFKVSASLDLTLSDLNQPQTIAAPSGAKTVTDFALPAPPALADPGSGLTQYVFFETMADKAMSLTSFNALSGDQVSLTVRGLGLDFDGIAAILAPNGDTLVSNDNHDNPGFGLGDYDPQIVNFTIPADGTYNVEVTEYAGNAGSYVLTINIQR